MRDTAEGNGMTWQPIETAPRDGTPILCFNPVMGVYNTAYQAHQTNEGDCFPCGFSGRPGTWYCAPTHWMPLPEGPSE